jgi:hypothetical protein
MAPQPIIFQILILPLLTHLSASDDVAACYEERPPGAAHVMLHQPV